MSWQENLGVNLIKNVEVKIGDNKTIAEMVDGNLKVEHYYKNEIIIEKDNRNKQGKSFLLREIIRNMNYVPKGI